MAMTASNPFMALDVPPLMNSAGTVKTVEQVRQLAGAPVPAVMVGSFTLEERPGNEGRTYYELPNGALNSLGLPGPSVDTWSKWVREMGAILTDHGQELWVSVAGFNPPEYRQLVEVALEAGADAVELNLGCPNVWSEGSQKPIVSLSVEETSNVLASVGDLFSTNQVGVKLSPILDPILLTEIDTLLGEIPVKFVTAINTVPNCFAFDDAGKPAIAFGAGLGGMSGAAIKWLGLGQLQQHRKLLLNTPLIGVGGIETGQDVVDYMSPEVGANACQVGTAFWRSGSKVLTRIIQELVDIQPR